MLLFTTCLLIFSAFSNAFGSELCKEKEWFDDLKGKCQPCQVCSQDSREMGPCTNFSDTVCMDLLEIRRFLATNKEMERQSPVGHPHPWHEMEGKESDVMIVFATDKPPVSSKTYFESMENEWTQIILVILSLAFIFMMSALVIMLLRYFGKLGNRNDTRKRAAAVRNRLFSRDRLNTTEYMNNLATLDRRLAIDEILEKRKRAIFEPQLLLPAAENPYADEVFVDISGLPARGPSSVHDYEELDHRKCLLQMQEQRQ